MKRSVRLLGLFAWLLCLATGVAAQETRGSIEGIVKDPSGAVLPGVTVQANGINVAGGQTAVTDASGIYRFLALQPGTYEVVGTLQGFQTARAEQVTLSLGQVLKVDMTMQLSTVTETVQVTSESPLIDVKQSTASQTVRADMIERLPKGRDFTSLVTLAPGANNESRSGGISIDGASSAENRYFIDGTDATNLRTGLAGKTLLPEFIEQVQVKSSGYQAEFGGATGGVVNVVTKSGTNSFRGDVGSYFQNDGMCCDERPTLRLVLDGRNASEYVTLAEDGYTRWEPFFQVGGPIVRNRLWFYGGYTPQLEDTDRTVTFRSNGLTQSYNSDEKRHYVTGNVVAQFTDKLRTRVATSYDEYNRAGRLPAKDGSSNFRTNFAGLGDHQPNLSTNATVDYAANNRLFLNAKVNWLSYDAQDTGVPSDIWVTFSGSNGVFPGATNVQPNGYNSVLTNRARTRDLYQRLALSGDASFFGDFAGRHAFKGGVQFQRIRNDVLDAEQAPHITFNWDASRSTLDHRSVRGTYGYYSWRQFGTIGDVHVNNLGFFFQDDWSVSNRLTLNLGIRTEQEEVPSYVEGLSGIKFNFGDKFSPRAGFAYDMKGDGKWKLYGSYGVFYDIMKLELPRGAFGGDKWIEQYYTLETLDYGSIGTNGNFPGTFIESVNFRIPSNDPACPECGAIDPDLKPMRTQEAIFGVAHELTSRVSLSARYVHKQLDRAIEDVGVLVPELGEVFYIANVGEGFATHIIGDEFPSLPKAKRDYDALEFVATKRFSNNWFGDVSYTLSRLYGNYPGLASSDENARTAPNVTRLFDGIVMAFDSHAQPVFGRLNTDRPHQFKINGFYELPSRTGIGVVFRAASGIPISHVTNMQSSLPVFYDGRLTDGRTPVFTQTNLRLTQDVPLPGNTRAQVVFEVDNLFDQDDTTDVFRNLTRDNVVITDEAFFAGFNMEQLLAAQPNIRRDPRYLLPNTFQVARSMRFGVRFTF
jgi:Carboxypeptidase regulatory-like domain/TonB dependent receptor/TonB-dependent Receptor Plug Domain